MMRVSLLDDENSILALTADLFDRALPGVEFRTFDRGSDYLIALESGWFPDVALIDWRLKDMDCLVVLRRCRVLCRNAGVFPSRFILTGEVTAVPEEALTLVDGVIEKPTGMRDLPQRVLLEQERKAGVLRDRYEAAMARHDEIYAALKERRPCPPI